MSMRSTYFFGFVIICLLLTTSVYLQLYKNVIPCPLCTLQRISFVLLGILFLLGLFIYKKFFSRIAINFFSMMISLCGMSLAARQIWLQHFATAGSSECGVSLQYMLQVLPLSQTFQKVFEGSAECTQQGWEFLSLNMAEWALTWFIIFFAMSLYLFLIGFKKNK